MISIKKDKKGFELLGEETLKVLIAVICIGVLVYLLVSIYFSVSNSGKLGQAKGTLTGENGIIAVINSEENNLDFPLTSPAGWYLFGFTEWSKPNLCLTEKCLCICAKTSSFANALDKYAQIKECDKKGTCSVVSNLKESFEIKIAKGEITSISIINTENEIEIKEN